MIRETLIDTGKSRLFVVKKFTSDHYDELIDILELQYEPEIIVRGKKCNQRRNIGFFSNDSVGYAYSGQIMKSQPLREMLLVSILDRVNEELDTKFNGILVNEYTSGEKYIGKHADDERYLDKKTSCVAGISYGATRKFRIRNKETSEIVMDIDHEPCMLIVMSGDFQKEFTHEIPQQKKIKDCRISLTFRHHTK